MDGSKSRLHTKDGQSPTILRLRIAPLLQLFLAQLLVVVLVERGESLFRRLAFLFLSRHAGHACASVHLHYTPETLWVQVDDDGKGPAISTGTSTGARPSGPGLGLVGMRERVSALGGRLHAGPQDGGGFRVRAELPSRGPS